MHFIQGGSALIGESVLNVLHGAKGRLSSTCAGLFMLIILLGMSKLIALIPVATLTGVIFTVVIHTFQFQTTMKLHLLPRIDAILIVLVTVLSVVTNLAVGIVVGVIVISIWYAWREGDAMITDQSLRDVKGQQCKTYKPKGPLFFATVRSLHNEIQILDDPHFVVFDMAESTITDFSGIMALDDLGAHYHEVSKKLYVQNLDEPSEQLLHKAGPLLRHIHILTNNDEIRDSKAGIEEEEGLSPGITIEYEPHKQL